MATPHRVTSDFDDLINEVNLDIPEASESITLHQLRRTIIHFCQKSKYWHEEIGPIFAIADISRYDLPTSARFDVAATVEMSFDNQGTIQQLQKTQDESVRYRFWQPTPFEIEVSPIDRLAGEQISLIAALVPKIYQGALEVSENVINDYRDELVAGVKARLYRMPRKPWSDPQLYGEHQRLYDAGWREALRRQRRGYDSQPYGDPNKPRSFM